MTQEDIFYKALIDKDCSFEGTFIVGVKTTGIFCRPSCSARKPKRENVEFFTSTKEAILRGYRACKVCRPMERLGVNPKFVNDALEMLEQSPTLKIKDYNLKKMGVEPTQLRRWFQKNHGITFQAYQRMYRINNAFRVYKTRKSVTDVAFNSGYESLSGFNNTFKSIIGKSPRKSKEMDMINMTHIETNLGPMIACATKKGICLLEFSDRKMLETELKRLRQKTKYPIVMGYNEHFKVLKEQLDLYFKGELKDFDLPLDIMVGTSFQQEVWELLRKIPYGSTISYTEQAELLNKKSAVRAIANANGMNQISIIIPCHRVIGVDGSLTGYGGGLWRKKKLLDLEQQSYKSVE